MLQLCAQLANALEYAVPGGVDGRARDAQRFGVQNRFLPPVADKAHVLLGKVDADGGIQILGDVGDNGFEQVVFAPDLMTLAKTIVGSKGDSYEESFS